MGDLKARWTKYFYELDANKNGTVDIDDGVLIATVFTAQQGDSVCALPTCSYCLVRSMCRDSVLVL